MEFSKKISKGDVIAVGDVHASWDLYSQFLQWVEGSGASVILLGDLIDRGGDDIAVLNATASIMEDPDYWGLESLSMVRGNHEQLFLDAAVGSSQSDWSLWLYNGGNSSAYEEMEENHFEWISKLPHFITVGDTLFVHAGVQPGKSPSDSLANGHSDQLVWIRKPFLENGPMLKQWSSSIKKVIHGHSITFMADGGDEDNPLPTVKSDRINLDTGAFLSNGRLTAYNVTQNTFHQFSRPQ
jgi:serine/threonine protein phosphatase 1